MTDADIPNPGAPATTALHRAIARMLAPLVRLLLARGVTLPALISLLKQVYVASAERDFPLRDRVVSDSRISLLTGVHRKDVRRLRQQEAAAAPENRSLSLGMQLVATWLADPLYLNGRGRPRVLPRRAANAADASFERLVAQVCRQDIRPRAMLDELLRLGVVEIDSRERVKLRRPAFVPEAGLDEKLVYFARNVGDHIATGAENLLGRQPPLLERGVHYSGLTPSDVAELQAAAERHSTRLLGQLNRRAQQMQKHNEGDGAATARINFGVYFCVDDSGNHGGTDE